MNNSMNATRGKNLLIIGNPHSDSSTKAFLGKILAILAPLSKDIYIICGDNPKYYPNCHWIEIDKSEKKKLKRIGSYISYQLNIALELIYHIKRIDIIIFLPSILVLPVLIAKFNSIPTIIYAGGSASNNIKFKGKSAWLSASFVIIKILETITFCLSNMIIIESESSLEFEGLKRYEHKVATCGIFVDIKKFYSYKNLNDRSNNVGYIGALTEIKGVLNLIKAIPIILRKRNDIRFLIGGGGNMYREIEKYIDDEQLGDFVTIFEWIPHAEVPCFLNELKLIVLPSLTEGLPNIILEAMACSTPVLATSVGAIPDIIKDGETGFIMEINSPEGIAKDIIRALDHSDLEKIADNAKVVIEQEFTYDASSSRWNELINNISKRDI